VGEGVLRTFYRTVRPFGAWRPIREKSGLSPEQLSEPSENAWRAVLNTCVGMAAITAAYLLPMYLVGHWLVPAAVCLAVVAGSVAILFHTWYRHLPAE